MKQSISFYCMLTFLLAFSAQIFAHTTSHKETITITVTTPGTLGELVLSQTEDFSDVKTLTVSGKLNNADLTNICVRMTSLENLYITWAMHKSVPCLIADFMAIP